MYSELSLSHQVFSQGEFLISGSLPVRRALTPNPTYDILLGVYTKLPRLYMFPQCQERQPLQPEQTMDINPFTMADEGMLNRDSAAVTSHSQNGKKVPLLLRMLKSPQTARSLWSATTGQLCNGDNADQTAFLGGDAIVEQAWEDQPVSHETNDNRVSEEHYLNGNIAPKVDIPIDPHLDAMFSAFHGSINQGPTPQSSIVLVPVYTDEPLLPSQSDDASIEYTFESETSSQSSSSSTEPVIHPFDPEELYDKSNLTTYVLYLHRNIWADGVMDTYPDNRSPYDRPDVLVPDADQLPLFREFEAAPRWQDTLLARCIRFSQTVQEQYVRWVLHPDHVQEIVARSDKWGIHR